MTWMTSLTRPCKEATTRRQSEVNDMWSFILDILIATAVVSAVAMVCYGIHEYGVKHGLVKRNYTYEDEEYEWEDEEE